MKTVSVAQAKAHLSAYLKAVEKAPLIITRNGKPVAFLVAAGDEDEMERLQMAHSTQLQAILEAARLRFHAGKGIPHDAFWQEVETEAAGEATKRSKTTKKRQ